MKNPPLPLSQELKEGLGCGLGVEPGGELGRDELAARERALLEDFLLVRDPQERLALIVEACAGEGIAEGERREADVVVGCVSRVWLRGGVEGGKLGLAWEAESPVVRGLVGLSCGVSLGGAAAEVRGYRSGLLGALGLDRQLSPTRWRGLAAVEARIGELAGR